MNLSKAEFHNLIFDVKAFYASLILKKRRLRRELAETEDQIKEMEYRYRMKPEGTQ